MAIAPRGFEVDPPKSSVIPRFGLLTTVPPITITDPHAWASGVEWEYDLCTSVEAFIDTCPPSGFVKSTESDLEFCHADPFVVKSSFTCSTLGKTVNEALDIVQRRLLAWESHKVEEVFWTGLTANAQINPSLAFGNDTCDIVPVDLSVTGALGVGAAIAILEEALTDVVPGGGVIHVPYGLAGYLANSRVLTREGDLYFSTTGFPIILGAGYPGSGPANVPAGAGTTWIFGTGPVGVWRSDYFVNPSDPFEGIDRYRNDLTVYAERFYAVGFSCAVFAVSVCL